MGEYKTREELFKYLEDYSGNRKAEISENKTSKPLLKSYVIETYRSNPEKQLDYNPFKDIPSITLSHQIDESLYKINISKTTGYLEKIDDRFWLFYSLDRSSECDVLVERIVKQTSLLDHLWISGKLFNVFWKHLLGMHKPHRFIRMSFEFDDYFYPRGKRGPEDEQDLDDVDERKISRIGFTEQKDVLDTILPRLQDVLPSFYVTSLLRFPSKTGSGGHDFYYSGKVTNRSENFRDHRQQILNVCDIYGKITQQIEDEVWFGLEKNTLNIDNHYYSLKGTPVVIMFEQELSQDKFDNFIYLTFDKKKGPFRLWGQPIRLGSRLVHIYGIDMHLWQEIYLEMTPKQFTLILPDGTCGNTVHRLVTNIQRYLDPKIKVSIGEKDYDHLSVSIASGVNFDESVDY